MRHLRNVALVAALLFVGDGVASQDIKMIDSPPAWELVGQRSLPDSPEDAPDAAAGCMTVMHFVLPDGSSARPRVLQGVFTTDVPKPSQTGFTQAVLDAAAGWRFRPTAVSVTPRIELQTVVVGLVPGDGGGKPRVVEGLDAQDPRVRSACDIGNLAAWGERNAISVAEALARDDQRVLVKGKDQPVTFWSTYKETVRPPQYPEELAQRGISACTVVGYVVGRDGTANDFRIMKSQTSPPIAPREKKAFEDASLYAVSKWRFAPGPDNLERVRAFQQAPIDFAVGENHKDNRMECEAADLP